MKKFKSGEYLVIVEPYEREGYTPLRTAIQHFKTFDDLLEYIGREEFKQILEEDLGERVNQKTIIEELELCNGDGVDFIHIYYLTNNKKLIPFIGCS